VLIVCGLAATDSVLVVKLATPPAPIVPWPIEVAPSSKVTTPEASVPLLDTVAVNDTFVLKALVAVELVRLVLVVFLGTVWVRLFDVLPEKFVSPL